MACAPFDICVTGAVCSIDIPICSERAHLRLLSRRTYCDGIYFPFYMLTIWVLKIEVIFTEQ